MHADTALADLRPPQRDLYGQDGGEHQWAEKQAETQLPEPARPPAKPEVQQPRPTHEPLHVQDRADGRQRPRRCEHEQGPGIRHHHRQQIHHIHFDLVRPVRVNHRLAP
jgi:hypothetical protein